jgi:hypothetical protein
MSVSATTIPTNTNIETGNINMDVYSLGERVNINTTVSPISLLPGSMQGLDGYYGFYSIVASNLTECVVTMPVISETAGVRNGWTTMIRNDSNITITVSTTTFAVICKISPGNTVSLNANTDDAWSVSHLLGDGQDGVLLCNNGEIAFSESMPVSHLAAGTTLSILQTNTDGVAEWVSNVTLPGSIAVQGTGLFFEQVTLIKTPTSLQTTGGILCGGRFTAVQAIDLGRELMVSGNPGVAGSVLTSRGPNKPPQWVAPASLP